MAEELEKAQAGDRIQLVITRFTSVEPLLYTRVCVKAWEQGQAPCF